MMRERADREKAAAATEKFPSAQFLITGVMGPHSNAHGPNEFLHVPSAEKLTCCVAQVLRDHQRARSA